jgi:hypothetical protein
MNHTTFRLLARSRAVRLAPLAAIDDALTKLGAVADRTIDSLDRERKLQLVTRFVRAIPALGVQTASVLEHELLAAIGVEPTGRHVLPVQTAISLVAVRNHLHALVTAVGVSWSDGMLVQSAVADVVRFVLERGGGTIEMTATSEHDIAVTIHSTKSLGTIPERQGPATPAWLAGAMNLAPRFSVRDDGKTTDLEFSFAMTRAAVA